MRLIGILFALSCSSLIAEQPVSKVGLTETKSSVRAFSPYGDVILPAIRLELDIRRSDGKVERSNLIVVYDPVGEHYIWRNTMQNFPGDTTSFYEELDSGRAALYAAPTEIIFFYMPSNLFVQEHRDHCGSLDCAETASIADVGRRAIEKIGYDSVEKEVAVAPALGRAFACDPEELRSNCPFTAKNIVSISRDGENWRLVVRNRWDQEIILDSKFDLVSTRRLPTVKLVPGRAAPPPEF